MDKIPYPLRYRRYNARTITVGGVQFGGGLPVVVQSMLSAPTRDVEACLREIRTLHRAGCEMIRLAVPSPKDLDAVPAIRRRMAEEGVQAPLVADIHYSAGLAVDACECFEKIRINPGNYTDRPKNTRRRIDHGDFEEGRLRLQAAIAPLVKNLKRYRCALRIGVNQGSLSARMMERFGDTPLGMVESALEMVELFEAVGFDQLVVSLKASNPMIVQKAYRLLVARQNSATPVALHLGVTEAGSGLMGRLKSLVGIGVLLADGIGDTIRVSLTEPGAEEIAYARALLEAIDTSVLSETADEGDWVRPLAEHRVINPATCIDGLQLGDGSSVKLGQRKGAGWGLENEAMFPDFYYWRQETRMGFEGKDIPMTELTAMASFGESGGLAGVLAAVDQPLFWLRRFYRDLGGSVPWPVGMVYPATGDELEPGLMIQLAGVLSEGLLDFLLVQPDITAEQLERMFGLLQATRVRMVATEYITCPSCGRTRFDLSTASRKIEAATRHLRGLKIGIMGCIVNGPGEMADADFGYVGAGAGKIDLYEGQRCVQRGIDEVDAVDQLIELIRSKGKWRDPVRQGDGSPTPSPADVRSYSGFSSTEVGFQNPLETADGQQRIGAADGFLRTEGAGDLVVDLHQSPADDGADRVVEPDVGVDIGKG
jgi:(E)-4-hydroxy-3-methylbut-2-enyl-diphosphate synthase